MKQVWVSVGLLVMLCACSGGGLAAADSLSSGLGARQSGVGPGGVEWNLGFSDEATTHRLCLTVKRGDDSTSLAFLHVPGGVFRMGANSGGEEDEKPEREVFVSTFWIGEFEVTAEQYAFFLNAMGMDRDGGAVYVDTLNPDGLLMRLEAGGFGPPKGFERFPAVGITWEGADAFCRWLSGETGLGISLPTEAQWEKAARGRAEDGRLFPWGVRLNPTYCRYKSRQPARVGSYAAGRSPYGTWDMAGNVAEWVADGYDAGYYARSPARDPEGPTTWTLRILRGGDYTCQFMDIPRLRTSARTARGGQDGDLTTGFRVAMNPAR